jgi:hypothetical protein
MYHEKSTLIAVIMLNAPAFMHSHKSRPLQILSDLDLPEGQAATAWGPSEP